MNDDVQPFNTQNQCFLVKRFFYFFGIFYLRFYRLSSLTLCFRSNLLKP